MGSRDWLRHNWLYLTCRSYRRLLRDERNTIQKQLILALWDAVKADRPKTVNEVIALKAAKECWLELHMANADNEVSVCPECGALPAVNGSNSCGHARTRVFSHYVK